MNTIEVLNEKIRSARDLDFGTIFNEAIELFKKTWVQGLLMQVFAFLVMLPFLIIVYVPIIAAAIAQEGGEFDPEAMNNVFAGLSIIYIILVVVLMIVLSTVITAIGAGFYRIIKKIDHGDSVLTKDFFYFVKSKYLMKLLGLMLMSMLIAIPAALLCYIPLIYVIVPMSLFVPIFAFNSELSVMEVVKASFSLGNKKWLILFGLIIISSLLAQIVGFLACGIGVFVTASFVYHPTYLVYKKVIGFGDENVIEEIGQIEN